MLAVQRQNSSKQSTPGYYLVRGREVINSSNSSRAVSDQEMASDPEIDYEHDSKAVEAGGTVRSLPFRPGAEGVISVRAVKRAEVGAMDRVPMVEVVEQRLTCLPLSHGPVEATMEGLAAADMAAGVDMEMIQPRRRQQLPLGNSHQVEWDYPVDLE